jgi:ankyrin repeat protein
MSLMLKRLFTLSLLLTLSQVHAAGSANSQEEIFIKHVEAGNMVEVEKLLDSGVNVNFKRSGDGGTALIIASGKNHLDVANLLVSRGANVNLSNQNGWTPLMAAVSRGSYPIAIFLLEKGADPNSKHIYGWTALKLASQKGKDDIVGLLKKFGARK